MSKTLKNLRLDRIDVVDKGANQDSRILIVKRDASCPPNKEKKPMTDEEKAAAATAEAEAKKRADEAEAVAKRQADEIAIAKREAAEAKAEIAKMRDERERDQFIAKSKDFKAYGPADTLWQDLRDISKALGPDRFAKFEQTLRAVQTQAESSALFKEVGASGYGDSLSPWAKIEKAVAEQVQKSGGVLTKEAAMTAYLNTPEGKALYTQHTNTMPGMIPGAGREE